MRVFLDDVLVDTPDGSLGSALTAARSAAGDRLVIEATADGRSIPPEHLSKPPGDKPYAQEVRFRSAAATQLVGWTLHESAESLEGVIGKHAAAAELIQGGDTEQSLTHLSAILEAWQGVMKGLELAESVASTKAGPAAAQQAGGRGLDWPEGFEPLVQQLGARLGEVKKGLAMQDWSELADVLAYEMDDLAASWAGLLRDMAARLETGAGFVGVETNADEDAA